MKIQTVSVFVDDQQKALEFYTGKLGFVVTADMPVGDYRWLTVADAQNLDGTHFSLEPNQHPAAQEFSRAMAADGIPWCILAVDDAQFEYDRLVGEGVTFTQPPTATGPVITSVLDDTCGNLLQLVQFAG
jgi:catechol 2,3-dioxygenase-like lactoylglutathione lyase family enzyme